MNLKMNINMCTSWYIVICIWIFGLLSGCTKETRAKQWGGNFTVDLPTGQKLVNATWKDDDLWYLLRNAKAGESRDTITFQQQKGNVVSLTGDGSVTFIEH